MTESSTSPKPCVTRDARRAHPARRRARPRPHRQPSQNPALGEVGRRGAMDWRCMPRLRPAIVRFPGPRFAAISFPRAAPERSTARWRLSRVDEATDHGSAIVKHASSRWGGKGVEVTDFAPRFFHRDRMFRPPSWCAGSAARRARRASRMACARAANGAARSRRSRAAATTCATSSRRTLRLTTDAPPTYVAEEHLVLAATARSACLRSGRDAVGGIEETARDFEEQTSLYWRPGHAPSRSRSSGRRR